MIDETLRSRAIAEDAVVNALNLEVVPVVRKTRAEVNRILAGAQALDSAAGVLTLDWNAQPAYKVTLAENVTSVLFKSATFDRGDFTLVVVADGVHAITGWPAEVQWASGSAPTFSTTAGHLDVVRLYFDGTTYSGWLEGAGGGGGAPAAHATTHENGGSDEIDVTGLSGLLADAQTPLAHKTSHENGGSDEISVLGLSGLLADAQTPLGHHTSHESGGGDAIKLDDLAAPDDNTDLNASTSKHGLLPKLDGDTTHFLRGDGSFAAPAGSSGSGASPLYLPPTSANSDDDELDSTSLAGAWNFRDTTNGAARTPSGSVDPYTALTGSTTAPRTTLHTNGRRSWLQVQATDSASALYIYKSITFPTNGFFWTRMRHTITGSSAPTSGSLLIFEIMASSSGNPDLNNRVYVGLAVTSGTYSLACDSFNGGAGGAASTAASFTIAPEYFGIHKVGTVYYPYFFNDQGAARCLKSGGFSNAFTPAFIGWRISTNNTNKPYDTAAFDFLRRLDVATVLPF